MEKRRLTHALSLGGAMTRKRLLPFVLALIMVAGLLPGSVFAETDGGLILTPGCECETLCDSTNPNPDCPVCPDDPAACAWHSDGDCGCGEDHTYIVCECESLCDEDNVNADCEHCAGDYAACMFVDPSWIDPMAAVKASGVVDLLDMYLGGYMNFIVYHTEKNDAGTVGTAGVDFKNGYPVSLIGANSLKNFEFEFLAGTGYDLVKVTDAYKKSLKDDGFFNSIEGDKNGNIIVFKNTSPLYGLIVRKSTGYLFISGIPKSAQGETYPISSVSELINVKIKEDKNTADPAVQKTFTFNLASGSQIAEWRPNQNTGITKGADDLTPVEYVVSHGYATVLNSRTDHSYALGMGASGVSKNMNSAVLSTWYPGNGDKMVFPYIATKNGSVEYYLYAYSPECDDCPAVPASTGNTTTGACAYGNCNMGRANAANSSNYPGDLSGNNKGDYVTFSTTGTTSYAPTFIKAATGGSGNPPIVPFSFQDACALLSDGGFLSLTLNVGDTYNIFEALCGSFPHLRGYDGGGCVQNDPKGWKNLSFIGDTSIIEITGPSDTTAKLKAKKVGTVETSNVMRFTPIQPNCSYWPSTYDASPFSTFISINIVGLVFNTNEDGDGGTTEATQGGKYYVQKLVFVPESDVDAGDEKWTWVTQNLVSSNPGMGDVLVTAATGVGLLIDSSGEFYTVGADGDVDISHLDLGTGYRVVNDPGGIITPITQAFFTPPNTIDAEAEIEGSGPGTLKITVTQEYGAYATGNLISDADSKLDCYQVYQLQVWDTASGQWKPITGKDGWYSIYNVTGTDVANTTTEIVFSNLDKDKDYRIVSKMAESTAVTTSGDAPTGTQLISESDVKIVIADDVNMFSAGTTINAILDGAKWDDSTPGAAPPVITYEDVTNPGNPDIANGDPLASDTTYKILADGEDTGRTISVDSNGIVTGDKVLDYRTLTMDKDDNTASTSALSNAGKDYEVISLGSDKYAVLKGSIVKVSATPKSGNTFDEWSTTTSGVTAPTGNNSTFKMPNKNVTLRATAKKTTSPSPHPRPNPHPQRQHRRERRRGRHNLRPGQDRPQGGRGENLHHHPRRRAPRS